MLSKKDQQIFDEWEKSSLKESGLNFEAFKKQKKFGKIVSEHQTTMDELSHGNPIKGLFRMLTGR